MGDRTSVVLTVLANQAEEAKSYFNKEISEEITHDPLITSFTFEEVNYGTLTFLPKLRKAGIPYESAWSSGDEYGSGSEFFWFTSDGVPLNKDIYDDDRNPDLMVLLEFIDQPEKLRQAILTHKENVTPPSWDNQEEYSKVYRMLQLVTPV